MCLLRLVRDSRFSLTKTIVYTDGSITCFQHHFAIRWELAGIFCFCSRNQKSQEENKHLLPMTCNVKARRACLQLALVMKIVLQREADCTVKGDHLMCMFILEQQDTSCSVQGSYCFLYSLFSSFQWSSCIKAL